MRIPRVTHKMIHLCIIFLVLKPICCDWVQIPQLKPHSFSITNRELPKFVTNQNKDEMYTEINDEMVHSTTTTASDDVLSEEEEEEELGTEPNEFLPFLKNIQQTLLKNTTKSYKGKIHLLENLRDEMLINIEDRIHQLWPVRTKRSTSRGHKDDNHMEVPSNEGALITIAFLTFAVYLIKLVLNIVTALKDKYNMTASSAAATNSLIGRRKRSIDNETYKIIQFIDEYNFN